MAHMITCSVVDYMVRDSLEWREKIPIDGPTYFI